MAGQARSDGSPDRAGTERAGREASAAELRRRLSGSPADYLFGAARNPNLTVRELVLLLRNRQAPANLLSEIAGDPRWTRYSEIKRGLVQHPRAPLALGRNLLPHLFWKDLSELAAAPQVNPLLRRAAENRLRARVTDMELGEQVALARRAVRGVIDLLCLSDRQPVLAALLDNQRLVELDAVKIASSPRAPATLLADLASHDRWGRRREVRLRLAANSNTPTPVTLRVLHGLPHGDLRRLVGDPTVRKIVRVGAERMLLRSEGRPGPVGRGPRVRP